MSIPSNFVYIQPCESASRQPHGVDVGRPLPSNNSTPHIAQPSQDNILSVPGEDQYLSGYLAPYSRPDTTIHGPNDYVPEGMTPSFNSHGEIVQVGESQGLDVHYSSVSHVETRATDREPLGLGYYPYHKIHLPAQMFRYPGEQQLPGSPSYNHPPSYPQPEARSPGASSSYSGSEMAVDSILFPESLNYPGFLPVQTVALSNTPRTSQANHSLDSSAYSGLIANGRYMPFVTSARQPRARPDGIHPSMKKEMVATPANRAAALHRRRGKNKCLYACEFGTCSQTFTAKHNLSNHMKSHLGIREYQCDFCNGAFTTKHVLKRHWKSCKKR